MKRNHRVWIALAVAGVLLAVALRLLMLSVPLERDEGGYAYIAGRWLSGDSLYVNVVDSKPPAVFATYAAILLFGRSVEAIRFSLVLWTMLTALLFFLFTRAVFGIRAAGLATALLALTQTAPAYFGFSANTEIFMATFILASLWAAWQPGEQWRWPRDLLAGALIGAAVLYKPVALTEGLPLAAIVLFGPGRPGRKMIRLLLIGIGFAAVQALCFGAFALWGDVEQMWFWAYGYNLGYAGSLPWSHRWRSLLYEMLVRGMLVRDGALWIMMAVGVGSLLKRRREGLPFLFPIVWLISAFLGVSASGRYAPHYWQQLLPPLCLLAALGVEAVGRALLRDGENQFWRRAAWVAVLALVLVYPTVSQARLVAQGAGLSRTLFGLNPFTEGKLIGDYLAERTAPDETIYIVGSEPQFLFHAGRRHASRIVFFAPLTGRHPDQEGLQRSVLVEITANRPRYVVWLNLQSSLVLEKDTPQYFFEQLRAFVGKKYRREAALVAVSSRETRLLTENLPPLGQGPIVLDIFRLADD